MINKKHLRVALVFMLVASMMLGLSLAVFASTYDAKLYVTYCDDETISYDFTLSKQGASHLYVEKTSGCLIVKAASLVVNGTTYHWTGEGIQHADLSDYSEGIWHWIFTPSKNLVISDSEGTSTLGCLEVSKIWEDLGTGATYEGSVTVNIYDADNNFVDALTLDEDNDWTGGLCGLLPGDYTFSEVTPEGWTPTYDPADRVLSVEAGDEPVEGAIGKITNTFDTGCLELEKFFKYPAGVDLPDQVEVMVYGPSYPDGKLVTLTAKDNWYWKACELISGKYSIKELDIPGWTSSYPLGTNVMVVADETARLEIVNEFDTGCLKVTKAFDGYPDGMDLPEVKIMIEGPSYGYFAEGKGKEVALNSGNNWTFEECGLLPGKYTVKELTIEGWVVAYSPSNSVMVVVGQTAHIAITNTYIPPEGETAWAMHSNGDWPYNPGRGGNWATYVEYERVMKEGGTVPLIAGQHYHVGNVKFSEPTDGKVTITISMVNGWKFEPVNENIKVQDYSKAPRGNPSPGSFSSKTTATGTSGSIEVLENSYYGVHVNVYGWDYVRYGFKETSLNDYLDHSRAALEELEEQGEVLAANNEEDLAENLGETDEDELEENVEAETVPEPKPKSEPKPVKEKAPDAPGWVKDVISDDSGTKSTWWNLD